MGKRRQILADTCTLSRHVNSMAWLLPRFEPRDCSNWERAQLWVVMNLLTPEYKDSITQLTSNNWTHSSNQKHCWASHLVLLTDENVLENHFLRSSHWFLILLSLRLASRFEYPSRYLVFSSLLGHPMWEGRGRPPDWLWTVSWRANWLHRILTGTGHGVGSI